MDMKQDFLENGTEIAGGEYIIRKVVGQGGMGVVYEAEQRVLSRLVAIKMMPRFFEDETLKVRFLDEAAAASKVNCRYLLQVFSAGFDKNYGFFIVFELLKGISLDDELRSNGAISPDELMDRLARPGLRALSAVHSKGIIHRDVKPGNFLLGDSNEFKLSDLGLAVFIGREAHTTEGVTVGTPGYMAPERIMSNYDRVSNAVDIYAFSMVMIRALTNRLPFKSKRTSALLSEQVRRNIGRAELIRLGVPNSFASALAKGIAIDPHLRWSTASEFLNELERAQAEVGKDELPKEALETIDDGFAYGAKKTEQVNSQKEIVHKRSFYPLGLVFFLLLIGVLFYTVTSKRSLHSDQNKLFLSRLQGVLSRDGAIREGFLECLEQLQKEVDRDSEEPSTKSKYLREIRNEIIDAKDPLRKDAFLFAYHLSNQRYELAEKLARKTLIEVWKDTESGQALVQKREISTFVLKGLNEELPLDCEDNEELLDEEPLKSQEFYFELPVDLYHLPSFLDYRALSLTRFALALERKGFTDLAKGILRSSLLILKRGSRDDAIIDELSSVYEKRGLNVAASLESKYRDALFWERWDEYQRLMDSLPDRKSLIGIGRKEKTRVEIGKTIEELIVAFFYFDALSLRDLSNPRATHHLCAIVDDLVEKYKSPVSTIATSELMQTCLKKKFLENKKRDAVRQMSFIVDNCENFPQRYFACSFLCNHAVRWSFLEQDQTSLDRVKSLFHTRDWKSLHWNLIEFSYERYQNKEISQTKLFEVLKRLKELSIIATKVKKYEGVTYALYGVMKVVNETLILKETYKSSNKLAALFEEAISPLEEVDNINEEAKYINRYMQYIKKGIVLLELLYRRKVLGEADRELTLEIEELLRHPLLKKERRLLGSSY